MPNPESANPKPSSTMANRKEAVLEKILVPIDFSDYASAAIDYAVRIGKLVGTHIALLYVVEIPRHQLSVDVYSSSERIRSNLNEMQTKAQERLESLAREIRTPGIQCTASVRLGIPYEEILAEADKIESDLIVLGGKGYSALARILLGSTAEQVVRFARCSVLVARHPPDQLPPTAAPERVGV
jgi:nucleotide-binding universal stress UspA family protein